MRGPMFGRLAGVAVLVLLLALPWMINAYAISTVTRILVFGLLAISVNLLTGRLTFMGRFATEVTDIAVPLAR